MKKTTETLRKLFAVDSTPTEDIAADADSRLFRWFKGNTSATACGTLTVMYSVLGLAAYIYGNKASATMFLVVALLYMSAWFAERYKEKK